MNNEELEPVQTSSSEPIQSTDRPDLPRGSVIAMKTWHELSTPMTLPPGASVAGYSRSSGRPRRRLEQRMRQFVARGGRYGVFLYLGEMPTHVELTKERAAQLVRLIQVAGAPERIARQADEEEAAKQGAELAQMVMERKRDQLSDRGVMVHSMKCWPQHFEAIVNGTKKFELRRDDRGGFLVGDLLYLNEYVVTDSEGNGEYTGREAVVRVTHLLNDSADGVASGFVLMSIELLGKRLREGETSPAGEMPKAEEK